MKLREIVKTIESMNKINEMLGNKKQFILLWLDTYHRVDIYTVKDLKQLKELYIKEAVEAILNYDFTQETNIIKREVVEYSFLEEKFVTDEREIKVELYVFEERY